MPFQLNEEDDGKVIVIHVRAGELSHPPKVRSSIRDYAFINEGEYLAVLTEYFFTSPDLLEKKEPELYGMLREMFHQDTVSRKFDATQHELSYV